MAKIRHIAIFSDDTKRLADFYCDAFGMTLTGSNASGACWVTDGAFDVALLKRRGEKAPKAGINHWGFTCESAEEKAAIVQRLKAWGIVPYSPYVDAPDAPRPYAEDAVKDPDGNRFDLSTGMRPTKLDAQGKGAAKPEDCPKIRHIALFSDDTKRLAKFYSEVFGLTVTGESQGDVWVTDGYVDFALLSRKRATAPKGIHHWGFTVEKAAKGDLYAKLKGMGLPPSDPRVEDPTIDRPYVEDKGHDIDGNRFDLTTGKREMDVEKARTRERLNQLQPAK